MLHNVHANASEHLETQFDIQGRVQRSRFAGSVRDVPGPIHKFFGGEEECGEQGTGVRDLSEPGKAWGNGNRGADDVAVWE